MTQLEVYGRLYSDADRRGRRLRSTWSRQARTHRTLGTFCVAGALILFGSGSLSTLALELVGRADLAPVSLLLVGVAGLLTSLNRLFGLAETAQRLTEGQQLLEQLLAESQVQWQCLLERAPAPEELQEHIRGLHEQVSALERAETRAMGQYLRDRLAALHGAGGVPVAESDSVTIVAEK